MKSYELSSIYGKNKKGYYGKAIVIEDESGNLFLQSYSTIVCGIIDGILKRFWNGYSVTTAQYVNDFAIQNGFGGGLSKKEWESILVESCPIHPINNNYKIAEHYTL